MDSDSNSEASDNEFKGLEEWVTMQHSTFCNWVNDKLMTVSEKVENLAKDMRSGEKLCKLMNVLKGKSIGRIKVNAVNHYAASGNIELAFQAMRKDGVKLVNIGAEDISKGSLKLILGLVWTLIRTYQLKSGGKLPAKKLMIKFFNAILYPYKEINNFTSDWNDGIALHGVIEYCKPGTFPDWMNLKVSRAEENCKSALQMGHRAFDIPIVIKPEHMANPNIDELSVMTQLSYYVTEGSPGYIKTMEWVNSKLCVSTISNFTTDWNSGRIASELAIELGADVPRVDGSSEELCKAAMKASENQLGVRHVISATDMTIPTVDHIGIMAYAAWHRIVPERKKKLKFAEVPEVIQPSPPRARSPSPPPPEPISAPAPIITPAIVPARTISENRDSLVRKTQIERKSVNSSVMSSTLLSSISSNTSTAPTIPVASKSVSFKREEVVVYMLDTWRVDATLNIMVDTSAFGNGAVRAEAHSPGSDLEDLRITRTEDFLNFISFRPTEKGNWKIQIFYENQEISESPYYVNVYDPSLARIIKTQIGKAAILKDYSFEVDCLQVGCKELDVFVTQNENQVPTEINLCGNDRYKITFYPRIHGIFNVSVFVGGIESPGSPFMVDATDARKVSADGLGLKECICGKEAFFSILATSAPDKKSEVIIMSPTGRNIKPTIQKVAPDRFNVSFVPKEEGNHTVEIFYDTNAVIGSPFYTIARKPKIFVKNLEQIVQKDRDYVFEIDASEVYDNGTIEIDSACPVKGYKQTGEHKYTVTYRPTDIGIVDFIIKYEHVEINGSPYRVEVQENNHFRRSLIR
ncbi:DgyrCDS8135 [Dimorphilus gyrociliatus]|uniref:DgyrCDS8135 n=1 Tax=Dimorphilus gyrociliatus TaxID=2664684 RepID=A0A7I8VTB7_9ANNE|nr:DgyrCDS8135 [Dimorphilus gyrociliatus]